MALWDCANAFSCNTTHIICYYNHARKIPLDRALKLFETRRGEVDRLLTSNEMSDYVHWQCTRTLFVFRSAPVCFRVRVDILFPIFVSCFVPLRRLPIPIPLSVVVRSSFMIERNSKSALNRSNDDIEQCEPQSTGTGPSTTTPTPLNMMMMMIFSVAIL